MKTFGEADAEEVISMQRLASREIRLASRSSETATAGNYAMTWTNSEPLNGARRTL
jgi:hypothetical protein